MERKIITVSPESSVSSSFPVFARFYNEERNLLAYKDGAVPFFLSLDSDRNDSAIAEMVSAVSANRRIPRGFIFEEFSVYKLADRGVQSLSPGFEDFAALCFNSSGYKVPQKDVAIIRNFTTKESFVLIPKAVVASGDLTVLILPRRRTISSEIKQQLTKTGDDFEANLEGMEADSLEELAIFAREGSTDYEINNSTDFVSLSRDDASTNTLVAEQAEYFQKLQAGDSQSKTKLDSTATIDVGIAGSSAYAGTKQYGPDHYYGTLSSISSNYSATLSSRGIYEVYEQLTGGLMKKLIQGKDYWIDGDGEINISGSTSSKRYEFFVSKDRIRRIVSSFDFETSDTYDLHKALYYANIKDWKIDKANSRIRIYKDGQLVKSNDKSGSYSEYSFTAGTYEYIVEDYSLTTVSTPASDTNTVDFHYDDPTVQDRTSLAFNKYQISTDPHLNTDGTGISADRSQQDVFLYNTGDGFLIDADEPKVTNSAGSITVQGIADPYAAGSFLTGVRDNYEDFQSEFSGGKTKLTKAIHDNTRVQQIEAQISQLKANLKAIVDNSTLTFSSYTSQVNAGQFLFLVLKGTAGDTFDLTYRDSSNDIIKREHNCKFDSEGRYVSVPFFFDTFGNTEASIKFEAEGDVDEYYVFR